MGLFPSTSIWTEILQVRNDPQKVQDLVARRYRQPVLAFARLAGLPPEDAEDVAQETFLTVTSEKFLIRADRSKGRFRALLAAVTRNKIAKFRERALAGVRDRRREVPLDDLDLPAETPDEPEFNRLWAANLVGMARERLAENPKVRAVFLHQGGTTYDDIAAQLGVPCTTINNWISRGRERLREEILTLIREYASEGDLQDEIEGLLKFLRMDPEDRGMERV